MSRATGRRGFLKAAVTLLTGATAPTVAVVTACEGRPNGGGAGSDVTPSHSHEQVVGLSDVDGIRVRRASDEDLPPPGGLVLGLFRYEPPDGISRTVHRLVLPWMDVRAGLYLRSGVPYRTRIVLDPNERDVTTSIVLSRRTSVSVYREAPRWIEGAPPWQVVVVVEAPRGNTRP
jgi:hypothetical protein